MLVKLLGRCEAEAIIKRSRRLGGGKREREREIGVLDQLSFVVDQTIIETQWSFI